MLEVDASQIPASIPRSSTQDTCRPFFSFPTGLSPSIAYLSRQVQVMKLRLRAGLTTPHLFYVSTKHSVCILLFFLADNNSISIDFSSCGYLDASVHRVVVSKETSQKIGSPIQIFPDQKLHALTQDFSQLATSFIFVLSQVIHLMA